MNPQSEARASVTESLLAPFRDDLGGLRLNLGCGRMRYPAHLGVDLGDAPAVDIQMDALSFLRSLPNESVASVYSRHMLEHFDPEGLRTLFAELDRVLRPGGQMEFIVPHYSNPFYYSDPTHRQPFGVHTFSYFCESSCLPRAVPSYSRIPGWHLTDVQLGFVPYGRIRILGRKVMMPADMLNSFINKSKNRIEIFERYLASIFSIYEVTFQLNKQAVNKR